MTDSPDIDRFQAYGLLDNISREFDRAGYPKDKQHRAQFAQLESAIELIFGNPNDPMDLQTKQNPAEGFRILRGLRHSFDEVAKHQKKLGESALIRKKAHLDKAENFTRFSGDISTALNKMQTR